MDYEELTSQDRRIMTWDKNNYDEFIRSFSEDELKEMNFYLSHHPFYPVDIEYNYSSFDDISALVYEYICHWLYEQLNDGIIWGTKELCSIALAMM